MSENVCPECRATIAPRAAACWLCGARLAPLTRDALSAPASGSKLKSDVFIIAAAIVFAVVVFPASIVIALFTLCWAAMR